jgi:hypothetical protein
VDKKIDIVSDRAKLKEWTKGHQIFQEFWEECKCQIEPTQREKLDSDLTTYKDKIANILSEMNLFRDFLREMPLIIAIGYWVENLVADEFWSERYLPKMRKLQQSGLIPFTEPKGDLVRLEYLIQRGHQDILENIRCVNEWSLLEKEEMVQCYLQFSHSLARYTLGIVGHGVDPDRSRVRYKEIKYESFIDFAQHLSERDSLIAQLLYFGAPSLEEILSLKRGNVRADIFSVQFDKGPIIFPRHLIQDLVVYQTASKGAKVLLFTNMRGAEVERAHLNQSFARACERMSKKIKITPGSLLKMESKSIEDLL